MSNEERILSEYLRDTLIKRRLSNNALAQYANIAEGTVRNILAGKRPTHDVLAKLATYLDEPIENLYRMAGMLPPDDQRRAEAIRLVEHLFEKLPPDDQAEVIEIVRMKLARREKS